MCIFCKKFSFSSLTCPSLFPRNVEKHGGHVSKQRDYMNLDEERAIRFCWGMKTTWPQSVSVSFISIQLVYYFPPIAPCSREHTIANSTHSNIKSNIFKTEDRVWWQTVAIPVFHDSGSFINARLTLTSHLKGITLCFKHWTLNKIYFHSGGSLKVSESLMQRCRRTKQH